MPEFRPKTVGRIDLRAPLVFARRYAGYSEGMPAPKMSNSRKRRWVRLGVLVPAKETAPAQEEQVVVSEEQEADDENDASPVSAEEGQKGWWEVTFSDGTVKKMRRSDVEDLGLLETDPVDQD